MNLGLRAYYPFNGNANDVSGNNNNPVTNTATLTADHNGNPNSAYHFDGIDNYMQIPNSPTLNISGNTMTLCAWVKPMGFYVGPCHGNSILMKGLSDGMPGNYLLRYDDNFYTGGANCQNIPPDADHENFYGTGIWCPQPGYAPYIQQNQWYSLVATYDGTTARLYINCELSVSYTTNIPDFINNYDLFLGRMGNPLYSYWLNADLDEVRIYDRVLNTDEINEYSECSLTNCDNWLHTQAAGQSVKVGDLDVTGTQITVEATINRTAPYTGSYLYGGDVVSKHTDPSDVNYLLRSNDAEITTSNGFFATAPICEIELNKTYHIAMVYNGSTLKFYRNGFLMSQVAATGTLHQNNVITTIGDWANYVTGVGTNFIGYINEVRIWNVARTQGEIQTYMNSSIPNPATQTGLLAYYTFDNLLNKQGNTAWNGTLMSVAAINSTNPNCSFTADSCNIIPVTGIGDIINDYTPVLALDVCKNKITVEDGAAFNAGDTVLMIQMKGAETDVTNTTTFGTITNYHNAGNYEFNIVKTKTGNIIELKNKLTRQYDIPAGKVQLIRVPYYTSVTVSNTLTCLPWDGNKGGVLVLNARDTITLNANLDVDAKGFTGGTGFNSNTSFLYCFDNDYNYPSTSEMDAGLKGESIVTLDNSIVRGKGAPASGGGGGLGHNSGGGGGSNAGAGGYGGYQLDNCGSYPYDNRGVGGHALSYNSTTNKIFLGGGGGAGNADNGGTYIPTGGNGGGIIIVNSGYLKSNGNLIQANGASGAICSDCHEGMPGGGGGGAVLLNVANLLDNTSTEQKGGSGADMGAAIDLGGRVAPGGGGGGGMLFFNGPVVPATLSAIHTGGLNGVIILDGNNPYGATAGVDGLNLVNLVLPVDTSLFKPNIDSVRFNTTNTSCFGFNFHGIGYTNTTGIVNWHWNFGDLSTADVQDATHTYATNGTYNVQLNVTDINGCKDSILQTITINCANAISGIINDYTPVQALDPCNNSLTVENASQFHVGDTVLLIQMKGAIIDSVNTTSFGNVTNYKNAGNYEFNYIKTITGNIIELKNILTRQYDLPGGRVQLVGVPYYISTNVAANLTCLPWDGTKGGVLAFNVRDTLTLNADIDVSYNGFRGGGTGNAFMCGIAEYATSLGTTGKKGESIAELNAPWDAGGGHLANGGGGSFGGNAGAGGGSNLVAGGIGGQEYDLCSALQARPGQALTNNLNTKIYLGGGGGGGQNDNGFTIYPGGNGGGIAFISSDYVKGNAHNINANGFSRSEVINDEGGAAGGGGGTVILVANNFINTININATGGAGNSNNNISFPVNCHGPGGGGSGGAVFVKQNALSVNITTNLNGGAAGLVLNPASSCFNTTHGAANGAAGNSLFNFVMNIDTTLFVPNIDSVRIQNSAVTCTSFDFHGIGYTNTTPIVQWNWNFGDGNFDTGQDVSHNYSGAGPYTVHLVGTDINGCKDSITIPVNLNSLTVNAGNDTAICSNGTVTHILHGNTTGTGYTWTPAGLLNNNTLQNPTATISATTMFYLNTTAAGGCTAIDSVLITINPLPALTTVNDFSICKFDSLLLTTVSTATTFQWTPPLSVNNPSVSSPHFTDTISQQLIVTGTNPVTGCFIKDTINATVKPLPVVLAVPDTSLCGPHPVTLTATGAQTYSWSPATDLSNSNISNPVFTGSNTQTYTVTGTGANACTAKDTITITVNAQPFISTITDNAVCKGDSIQLTTNTDAETIQWTPAASISNPTITDPYFHDVVTQQMIVTGTNATGCFVKDTVTITVKPLPVVHTIADTALCGPHNITFTTTGAQTYSWLPATGLSNPNSGSPVFSGTSTQTYTVTGTASNACVAKDTVSITINTVPLVSATSPFTICRNDVLQLTSNSNAETTHWSPAASVSNPTITNPNFTDSVSQQMIITGTNTSTGCFASDTVVVTVKPLPLVRTIPDTTTCTTNTITLFTSGAQTYSWLPVTGLDNPIGQNPVFTGNGFNTFYVTGTGANGCIAIDTVNINITPKPVFNAPENKDICMNSSVQLNGNNGTNYQYNWSSGTNLSSTTIVDPVANPTVSTIYSLLIHDEVCRYDSTFTVQVVVHPLPVVTAGKTNDMDCSTPQSQLTSSGAVHYEWIPGTYLNDATISNPIASPYVTTHYIVTGTDVNGCVDTDTVTVIVKGSKYFGFAIPNAFTPNGDFINDCFGVTYWGETKNFHLMVYNRWGNKVFETFNVAQCWDGTYNGNPCDVGNYVYYLTGETLCGKVTRKGNLVLIR